MEKVLKVTGSSVDKGYVPGIKIAGKYLEEFNFHRNDFVFVICEKDKIIIKKATKPELIRRMTEKNPELKNLIKSLDLV